MEITAHAYVVRGNASALPRLLALLQKEGVKTRANPDLWVREFSTFTIDDARELREKAALSAVGKDGRIFIVVTPTIPAEAQNALLKTLEEPRSGAKFFLIVPSPQTLLPTLLSRTTPLSLPKYEHPMSIIGVEEFLEAPPNKRLEMLKPLLEKGDDDRRDVAGILDFLAELEHAYAKSARENKTGIRALYRARRYVSDRGALLKVLLEQVALLV